MKEIDELINKYEHYCGLLQSEVARRERFQSHIEQGTNGAITATLNVTLAKEMMKLIEVFLNDLYELREGNKNL